MLKWPKFREETPTKGIACEQAAQKGNPLSMAIFLAITRAESFYPVVSIGYHQLARRRTICNRCYGTHSLFQWIGL